MRILLLAYACEPNRGSEPGVGWQWALNLAQDTTKDVYVLTRSNNKNIIDGYWKNNVCPANLHFYYYDLPPFFVWLKRHGLSVNIYYSLWLQGCIGVLKDLHEEYRFDMAHHITFGVYRDACLLYKLGIPFVTGPLGGGEYTPYQFAKLYSYKEIVREYLRKLMNELSMLNPYLRKSFDRASLILAKTPETKNVLRKWESKTIVNLEIGIDRISFAQQEHDKNTFLFVGRFIYWKGIKLVLRAFQLYQSSHPTAKLFFIGKGKMKSYIDRFAEDNNLKNNIMIIEWIEQKELKAYYLKSCAMLFPSLHDSSGNVVLEALACGLPVLCLDCGGPAIVLGKGLEDTIETTKGKSVYEVIQGLASKMEMLTSDASRYDEISQKCLKRAESLLWERTVFDAYKLIDKKLFNI